MYTWETGWSFFAHQAEQTKQPAMRTQDLSKREPELNLLRVLHHLDHQHLVVDIEPGPNLLDAPPGKMHRIFLIELLIGEQPILIDDHEAFLPVAQNLRFLQQFPVNLTIVNQWLRDPWDLLLLRLSQFQTRLDELLLDYFREDKVVCWQAAVLVGLGC